MEDEDLSSAYDSAEAIRRVWEVSPGYVRVLAQAVYRGERTPKDAAGLLAHRALAGAEHPLMPYLRAAAEVRLREIAEGAHQ